MLWLKFTVTTNISVLN